MKKEIINSVFHSYYNQHITAVIVTENEIRNFSLDCSLLHLMKFYKDRLYFTRKSRTVDGPHTEIVLLDDIDALLEQFKTIYCDERPIMLLYSFYLPCYGWQYSSGCATKLCQLADCQKLEINIGYEYVHWEEVPRDLWIPRVHADNRKLSIRNAKNVHVYYDPDIFCPGGVQQ